MAQYFFEFNLAENKYSENFLKLSRSHRTGTTLKKKNIFKTSLTHLLAQGGTSVRLGPR